MDNRNCIIPEEYWIDYHLGKLLPAKAEALRQHREMCPHCLAASREWEALLAAPASAQSEPPAAPAKAPARLKARVRLRGAAVRARRLFATASRRRAAAASSLAVIAIALAALVYGSVNEPEKAVDAQDYAEQHEPNAAQVLSRPDTVVYTLDPNSFQPSGGIPQLARERVWLNKRTHEMFLLLEGMLPSNDLDVQVWAKSNGRVSNLGLLQFNENLAHLYSSNVWPEGWDSLALTIEPKGGSDAPTTPETASVLLDGRE